MTAKVGDFGFAHELPQLLPGRTMVTAAIVARSLGYCPPEFMDCKVSPKSDVYSYGVVSCCYINIIYSNQFCIEQVALETFTGQEAYNKERSDQKLVRNS